MFLAARNSYFFQTDSKMEKRPSLALRFFSPYFFIFCLQENTHFSSRSANATKSQKHNACFVNILLVGSQNKRFKEKRKRNKKRYRESCRKKKRSRKSEREKREKREKRDIENRHWQFFRLVNRTENVYYL